MKYNLKNNKSKKEAAMDFKNNYLIPVLIFMFTFLMFSCDTTDSNEPEIEFEDGISIDIIELLGEDLIDIIENELQILIHRGDNPPDIAAMFPDRNSEDLTFLMTELLLLRTNVPQDEGNFEQGTRFQDNYVRFLSQDMDAFTIDFDQTSPAGPPTLGPGSFIIGNGNRFSVFGPATLEDPDGTLTLVNVFSGVITEAGISAPHLALVMVDNAGLDDRFIPNDTGRSFNDSDGVATSENWPGSETQAPTAALMHKAARFINQDN